MHRKAFQVQVELNIQAITCPGVWLCPVGKISLQLYMLDSCIQTVSAEPVFPILCHEKFIFYKTFYAAQRLSELQKLLNKECLYIELIQWQTCEVGNVLATFETNLCELLYPSVHEGAIPGIDIDLLMESSRNFPGVIAPKIEVCTKTVIEDTVCDGKKESAFVVNPKVIQSKGGTIRSNCMHQRKVCHSAGYNRSRKRFPALPKTGRPIFTYRKVEDDLLSRKPQGLGPVHKEVCKCRSIRSKNDIVLRSFMDTCKEKTNYYECPSSKIKMNVWSKPNFLSKVTNCLCGAGHNFEHCPVCSKYTYYFEDISAVSPGTKKNIAKLPCKTIHDRKSCACQRSSQSHAGKVSCEKIGSTRNASVIRCKCAEEQEDNRLCLCSSKSKRSLAEKLHQRLNETLESCAEPFDSCRTDNFSDSQGLSYVKLFPIILCVCLTMILTGLIWLSKLFIIVTNFDTY